MKVKLSLYKTRRRVQEWCHSSTHSRTRYLMDVMVTCTFWLLGLLSNSLQHPSRKRLIGPLSHCGQFGEDIIFVPAWKRTTIPHLSSPYPRPGTYEHIWSQHKQPHISLLWPEQMEGQTTERRVNGVNLQEYVDIGPRVSKYWLHHPTK